MLALFLLYIRTIIIIYLNYVPLNELNKGDLSPRRTTLQQPVQQIQTRLRQPVAKPPHQVQNISQQTPEQESSITITPPLRRYSQQSLHRLKLIKRGATHPNLAKIRQHPKLFIRRGRGKGGV